MIFTLNYLKYFFEQGGALVKVFFIGWNDEVQVFNVKIKALNDLFQRVCKTSLTSHLDRGGTEPKFSKLNRARALTSRARAELRAHIINISRARAELRARVFRAEPSLTIFEPNPSRAFEPQKWKFFSQYLQNFRQEV